MGEGFRDSLVFQGWQRCSSSRGCGFFFGVFQDWWADSGQVALLLAFLLLEIILVLVHGMASPTAVSFATFLAVVHDLAIDGFGGWLCDAGEIGENYPKTQGCLKEVISGLLLVGIESQMVSHRPKPAGDALVDGGIEYDWAAVVPGDDQGS